MLVAWLAGSAGVSSSTRVGYAMGMVKLFSLNGKQSADAAHRRGDVHKCQDFICRMAEAAVKVIGICRRIQRIHRRNARTFHERRAMPF
jgi:hypothetical protein